MNGFFLLIWHFFSTGMFKIGVNMLIEVRTLIGYTYPKLRYTNFELLFGQQKYCNGSNIFFPKEAYRCA